MYTVMIVDDEPMVKKMLRKLIDASGRFQVTGEAEDGREALDKIVSAPPDILITDIRMPVMDGLELIATLEEKGLRPEVVVISGHDDFSYAQKAIRFGVAEYLLKPIRPELLMETLDRLAARFEKRRQAEAKNARLVVVCREEADRLAEAVWMLDEQSLRESLERCEEALEASEADAMQQRTFYAQLVSLADENLRKKGASVLPADETAAEPPPETEEAPNKHAAGLLQAAMERLRQARNWGSHQNIQRAVEYVKQHFTSSNLSLQDAAEQAHMSPAYFSRSFKEEMGISFVHYVMQLRIELAKRLLEDPGFKTSEIPEAIGYTDYPHFAKVFKKVCGISPSEYRKRLGV